MLKNRYLRKAQQLGTECVKGGYTKMCFNGIAKEATDKKNYYFTTI